MNTALDDTAADRCQIVTVYLLGVLARGAEPRGRRTTAPDADRLIGRQGISFSQPAPKKMHHDFAHRLPLEGALGLDAPIQIIGNLNGCFHATKIPVFQYSCQPLIPLLQQFSLTCQ